MFALEQGPFGMSMAEDEVARGADVLFLDHAHEGAEPMTFRDLFLRSRAFEYIVAGMSIPHLKRDCEEVSAGRHFHSFCL